MENREKTIHQLKRDVLLAYLNKKTPGMSKIAKSHWEQKYESSRLELEKAIEKESEKAG